MQELESQTRHSFIKLINYFAKGQSSNDLLYLFFKNADEQTFTNVIAELSISTTQLNKEIENIITNLQKEVDEIVANLKKHSELKDVDGISFWKHKLECFKQFVSMSGYRCKKNTVDNTYTIYCKLSLEGLNND